MLDLKFLETLVDEALANETESTLVEWLLTQRSDNLFSYFGQGDVKNILCSSHSNFEVSKVEEMEFSNTQECRDIVNNYINSGLSIAA